MRRIAVLAVAVVVVLAIVLLAGRGGGDNDATQVRATLAEYTRAGDQKDYATICRRFLAPHLLDQMRQIRLPCPAALARGLSGVRAPMLTVKSVKVTGTTALAEVHTAAANQPPLDGTIELIKVDGLWRLLSVAEQTGKTAP